MRQELHAPAQLEKGIIAHVFQTRAMIGMKVSQGDRQDLIDIQVHESTASPFAHDFANGMRTINQQPRTFGLQGQAGGVIAHRKGISHAQRQEAKTSHQKISPRAIASPSRLPVNSSQFRADFLLTRPLSPSGERVGVRGQGFAKS